MGIVVGCRVRDRVSVVLNKTVSPQPFEVSEDARRSLLVWVTSSAMLGQMLLFPSECHNSLHISTRQHARIVHDRESAIGLDPSRYGTDSVQRTKAALIYPKTGNLRTVQLQLAHTKTNSSFRYLEVALSHALNTARKIES